MKNQYRCAFQGYLCVLLWTNIYEKVKEQK